MSPTLAGGTGRATELVISCDGDRTSLTPVLDVQPVKATQASNIAEKPDKRIGNPHTKNKSADQETLSDPTAFNC